MERIFLSYHYTPVSPIVTSLQNIIESQGIRVETGIDLGGGVLHDEVKKRIEASDALVALLSRDDPLANGRYRPAGWVEAEVQFGRDLKKLVIAIVETLVDASKVYAHHERIDLDPDHPLEAVVKLARTVGKWRAMAGRTIRARLQPDDVIDVIDAEAECTFQLQRRGKKGDWVRGSVVPEPGAVFVYLPGVPDDDATIQVSISSNGKRWRSRFTPQDVLVRLEADK